MCPLVRLGKNTLLQIYILLYREVYNKVLYIDNPTASFSINFIDFYHTSVDRDHVRTKRLPCVFPKEKYSRP